MTRFCGNCGNPMGSVDRCPRCGWGMPGAAAPMAAPAPKKKRKKPVLILLALLLAALLIALALHFLGVIDLPLLSDGGADEIPRETLTRPEAEAYLSRQGSVSGPESAQNAALRTEAEALREFAARGFGVVEITACYNADGAYYDERVIEGGSEKHPYYKAIYRTPDEVLWAITLMGDAFYADPISYNGEERWSVPHVLSDTGTYRTYDGKANAFFTVTPDPDALFVKRVDRIDADTLDEMGLWEVDEP